MKEQRTIQTPGKLMVAGEFAVLEPGHSLVVMAVDRFVNVTITEAQDGKVSLTDFNLYDLPWEYNNAKVHIKSDETKKDFVETAMGLTLAYLEALHIASKPFSLSIKSELDDISGLKYGLGSSAAVVTGVVKAILHHFLNKQPDEEVVFKLASMAHVKVQGNGSCADIAASTYGGLLHYQAFQSEWLLNEMKHEENIKTLVDMPWENLEIRSVNLPENVVTCIGWTGSPASTGSLVKEIKKLKKAKPMEYEQFLQASKHAVATVLTGMKQNEKAIFYEGIEANRVALAQLGETANVAIETDRLLRLSMEANRLGGAGKLSGAGGGDCGIAFVDTHLKADLLQKAWLLHEIKPLEMAISPVGADE